MFGNLIGVYFVLKCVCVFANIHPISFCLNFVTSKVYLRQVLFNANHIYQVEANLYNETGDE